MTEEERVQFKLMLPTTLKAGLEGRAHLNRRSLSAEIIAILFNAYRGPKVSMLQQHLDKSNDLSQKTELEKDEIIKSLTATIADKEKIIQLLENSIDIERLSLRKTADEYIDLLWEILGNAEEIPAYLLVNAELKLSRFEGEPDDDLSFEEEKALHDPESEEGRKVVARIAERARVRFKNKLAEIDKIFSSSGRDRHRQ